MGDLITAAANSPEPEFEYRPSKILVCLVWGGDEFGWSVEETYHDGGFADIEQAGGFLDYRVLDLIDEKAEGWWLLEGFTISWSRDYWGEVDAEYDITGQRRATWADVREIAGGAPWWSWLVPWMRPPWTWTP